MPRPSSPVRDTAEHRETLARMREGRQRRKKEEEMALKSRVEEEDNEKEWEDSLVTHLEYMINGVICMVSASLPASETPPDYVTALIIILVNVALNLMFRSTTLDRVLLYSINLLLPASSDLIRRIDEVPGKMPPIMWLVFLSSNTLAVALGWWYYIRKGTRQDNEWRQNVVAIAVIAANVLVGLLTGHVSVDMVLRWLGVMKNMLIHWTVKQ